MLHFYRNLGEYVDIEVGWRNSKRTYPCYEDVVRSPTSNGNTFGKFPNKDFVSLLQFLMEVA